MLEAALKLNKDLYVHTMRTLDLLAMEPGMVNGDTESSTAGLKIKTEEMQCQVFNQYMVNFGKSYMRSS